MATRPPLHLDNSKASDAAWSPPLEPKSWEEGPLPLTVEWVTTALQIGGSLAPGGVITSLQFDPLHVRRGEGDRLRRVLLQGNGEGVPASVYVKDLEPHEAAFYAHVVPKLQGVRTPRVLFRGASLLVLEDVLAPHWDEAGSACSESRGVASRRAAELLSAYARLHGATWGDAELARGASAEGESLSRGLLAGRDWRRAASRPWIREAMLAAARAGVVGRRSLSLSLAVAEQWPSCGAAMKRALSIVHGDPHGGNILDVSAGSHWVQPPCLLDFEFAAFDHPAWDLALLVFQLWASQWAQAPARSCQSLALVYVKELEHCGVQNYSVEDCTADLGIAIPLCFVGFLLSRVAETFAEWWRSDTDYGVASDLGQRTLAAEAFWLEDALAGPDSEVLLAGLGSPVETRYHAELEFQDSAAGGREGGNNEPQPPWAGNFSEVEF